MDGASYALFERGDVGLAEEPGRVDHAAGQGGKIPGGGFGVRHAVQGQGRGDGLDDGPFQRFGAPASCRPRRRRAPW